MRILDEKLLYKNISDRQRHLLETGRVGRCEILVRQDGKTVFHESFGCKTNLMYRLASMTKPVTAAAVLSEVQKGRLSLEDKVSRFFDGFADQYVGNPKGKSQKRDHDTDAVKPYERHFV